MSLDDNLKAALEEAKAGIRSVENADARDTARALLYQVPALPVDEEQERSIEALLRRAKAKQAEASTEARRALPWSEEP